MSEAPCFCPHCGYNLKRDAVVERDGWRIDPLENAVSFGDKAVRMTRQMVGIMHTLATATRPTRIAAIANRVSDRDISGESVRVQVLRIRKVLRERNLPCPIATSRGIGYVWQVPA